MKTVILTEQTTIDGSIYFPGSAIVSDGIAAALDDAGVLDGSPIDYRAPNPFGQMIFRGAFDDETAYVAGDVVTEGGAVFVAITESLDEDTDDTDFFVPLALEGGAELAAILANIPTTHIAPIGATTNLTAVPGAFADLAAVQTYLAGANVVPRIESRLDALEGKTDTIIDGLEDARIFATA